MEAGLNRLIFAWWREGNHPNQLYSVWLDLCKAVTARMSNLASVWKLSNGEVHMCMVAQFVEANTWKIPSPFLLFSPQFTGRTVQVQRDFKWLNPLQTHIQLPFPPQEPAPCSAFSCSKMQGCPAPQLLHSGACKLERGDTVPSKWGDVLSSSCWTSLSGADTCRHKTLNPGSPEVLKIFYKGICILLKQIAPGHPLQLYIKGMYTQRRERERELGRDSSWDCYLGDDAWLSKPVASKVIVESLFFCCHCKWLLAPESNLSDLLPKIRYGVCHALICLFSGKVRFSGLHFLSQLTYQEWPTFLWVIFVNSCQYQLGSVHALLSYLPWTLRFLTCFLQDFVSFLVNSTLGSAYKFFMILFFSAISVQFSWKSVW